MSWHESKAPERPDCAGCRDRHNNGGFGPRHDPSPLCQSGKRPHCTCNACF